MLHACSIFVWIMVNIQWLHTILNRKSTDKALFCLYEEIYLIWVTYLFDLWNKNRESNRELNRELSESLHP